MAQNTYNGTLLYTVPSGYVAVVRDIDVVVDTGPCEFYLQGTAAQAIIFEQGAAAGTYWHYETRSVFIALETFKFIVALGHADFTVCGFLLQTP